MECRFIAILLIWLFTACNDEEKRIFDVLYDEDTGIDFINQLTPTDSLNILDYLYFYNGGGVAIGDINNDNLPDIFFSGNMVENRLYLNQGNLKFIDITNKAGVGGNSDWNTGVTMTDINGDGFLDIYVCAVTGILGLVGHNELFINQGDGTFVEQSAQYGLDHRNYSTSASFFDYDLDGDLDMYLLNHSIHNVNSFGKTSIRNDRDEKSGDKLLRNDNGRFIDVSEETGVYGGANGYGLGISISDFDQDGFPDLYISNDFHENDYFYVNNGDGTFTESIKAYFGHISKFSMGSDAADINHDGYPELITLDMLPDSEIVLKSSAREDSYSNLELRTAILGYHHQYPRNMLHVNRSGQTYSESGLMANIAASDWSWSALFADYDLDGEQDLFISNGIVKRPNDLDYIKFISNEEIKNRLASTNLVDEEALKKMPAGVVKNKFYKGSPNVSFDDKSLEWVSSEKFISNGAAWGDLDLDGDLDIVTNNLNYAATIYENRSGDSGDKCFLVVASSSGAANRFGFGAKIYAYQNGILQYKELTPSRGFQSSSEPIAHFGFNTCGRIDSLLVIWPNGKESSLYDVEVNQFLEVDGDRAIVTHKQEKYSAPKELFVRKEFLGLDYAHEENSYVDFNRQKLIPYKISDRGPATVVGDINGDGKDDVFFGSSKHGSSSLYIQENGSFVDRTSQALMADSIAEDETAILLDVNQDGRNDLIVASAGGEFFGKSEALLDRLYLNNPSGFEKAQWPVLYANTSVMEYSDYDNDGDIDIFVGVSAVSNDFGKSPSSYLLKNNRGFFELDDQEVLRDIGMVTDAVWSDFNNDNIDDLILVGEWMSPIFLENRQGKLVNVSVDVQKEVYTGLWRAIIQFDIDEDGDIDYLLGNWGLNSKFKASMDNPLKMYYGDFDGNATTETILAMEKMGDYYPIRGLDALADQLEPLLKKKFTSYKGFAGKTLFEIFNEGLLRDGVEFNVNTLGSGYLRNDDGIFEFKPFPRDLQLAPINCFLKYDFDRDGREEVLCAGNYFGADPYHGRLEGLPITLIEDDQTTIPQWGMKLNHEVVRGLNIVNVENRPHLLVTVNNGISAVFEIRSGTF